ncbi:MAG: Holliday junction branch migration protein RuvA [Faecalibacillus faecis]
MISVKGIGCKSACTMLASGDVEGICEAIESGNMTYLKKIPGIGPKAAGQIILDLQGKVTATKQTVVNQELEEAMEVLIALGYKQSEVDKVVKKLTDENLDTNGYVKKH